MLREELWYTLHERSRDRLSVRRYQLQAQEIAMQLLCVHVVLKNEIRHKGLHTGTLYIHYTHSLYIQEYGA